jgi:hypothetical protein
MFTPVELIQKLPILIDYPAPTIDIIKFDSSDFRCSSSEQEIEIHQGYPSDFEDLLHFWVKSLMSQDWSHGFRHFSPYAESGKCQIISEDNFNELTKYVLGLNQPLSLPLHFTSKFISALQMYDDWNDQAVIAAYEDRYISFYWTTSA